MSAQFEYPRPVNPDAAEDSLEAPTPYIDHGTGRIDPERYYSHEYMEQEWERLWTRVWLIAGPRSDLREPGDYFTFDIGRESILVTLDEDETVRAFYNVCPHRGNRLVLNDSGCVARFTCTFHSWSFELDGKCASITDEKTFRPGVISERPRLKKIRVEEKAGLIFINMDEDAPPLAERFGLPDGYLEAYQLDKMVAVRHVVSEWGANWKTRAPPFSPSPSTPASSMRTFAASFSSTATLPSVPGVSHAPGHHRCVSGAWSRNRGRPCRQTIPGPGCRSAAAPPWHWPR